MTEVGAWVGVGQVGEVLIQRGFAKEVGELWLTREILNESGGAVLEVGKVLRNLGSQCRN